MNREVRGGDEENNSLEVFGRTFRNDELSGLREGLLTACRL